MSSGHNSIFFAIPAAVLVFSCLLIAPLLAYDAKAEKVLSNLSPETRQVKICELEGMERIGKDKTKKLMYPEHVMIDYLKPPHRKGEDTVWGNHALIRSQGVWYYLAYYCTTNPDHSHVTLFNYKLGNKIERSQWDELGLFP